MLSLSHSRITSCCVCACVCVCVWLWLQFAFVFYTNSTLKWTVIKSKLIWCEKNGDRHSLKMLEVAVTATKTCRQRNNNYKALSPPHYTNNNKLLQPYYYTEKWWLCVRASECAYLCWIMFKHFWVSHTRNIFKLQSQVAASRETIEANEKQVSAKAAGQFVINKIG